MSKNLLKLNIHIDRRSANCGSGWFLGISGLSAGELEALHAAGETTDIRGCGMYCLPAKLDEEKLFAVVRSISVKGKVCCSPAVKAHYGLK